MPGYIKISLGKVAAKKMEVDSGFKNLFSTQQQEMFKMGILPKEFTIHHAEDIGKYQTYPIVKGNVVV